MVKLTQTICRQQPTNCLSEFAHFVGLALKELKKFFHIAFSLSIILLYHVLDIIVYLKSDLIVFKGLLLYEV